MAEEGDKGEEGILTLETLLLSREVSPGAWLATPVADRQHVAYGSEAGVADQQERFLSEHLLTQPPRVLARYHLEAGTRLHRQLVRLERPGLPPRVEGRLELELSGVVSPDGRGDWVFVPALDHTFYLADGEDLRERFASEVERIASARELDDHDWLRLFPAEDDTLEPITLHFDHAGEGIAGRARALRQKRIQELKRKNATELLEKVGRALHLEVEAKMVPLTGRDRELEALGAMLDGPSRASVLLVGREAVGKSALLRAWLAPKRKERLVFATSGAKLVAGMSGFGQWQEQLERVMEAAELLDAVLYFPSFGELLGERPERGGVDVVGALRRWVVEGRVRVVGELPPEAVEAARRRHVSLFGAMTRLALEPLDEAQTRDAAKALVARWARREDRPRIDPAVIDPVVELAKRYLPYRAFPGKVIRFLEELLVTAESEASPPSVVDLERAYDAFSLATQIPAFLLREDRPLLADRVIATFRERMVGQAEAVRRVVETLCVVKARLQPEGKPLASFLFIGPTGVGKTELARTLTRFLFGDEERMVRFDMSEYADGLAAERLIAGTHDSAGLLTSKVREQPFCVLLLDEIEKAHPAVLDLLLQVLGEGRLSDARGQTTHFDNAIIILTSNLGASHQRAPLGFPDRRETAESQYDRAIHQAFRPELVNRLDRVITFHPLTEEEVAQVVTIALRRIGERRGIQQGGLGLELSEGALAQVAAEGYSDTYGVRALRRHLDRAVVDPVSELVASLGPEAQGAFVWVARPEEPDCPHHSAKHRLRSLIRSDLRFDVFRRDAATGKKALRGVWGVVALRREADRLMQLETVLRIDEQIGMLRSQIALAARAQRKSRKRRVVDQVDLERMRIELHRLSTAYDAAREKQLDLHAAEQLALAALYAGDDADSLYAEASALDDEFKRRLFYLLVAERPSRNAITLLLSEPGRPGLLRAWLDGLYRNAPHRHFRVIAHVRDREQMKRGWPSDPAWPAERAWSPPKDEAWMRPHVVDRPGNHRAVLLRIEGPAAALLLGLEAGLHRRVSQAKDETPSHLLIERLALETQLEDEDWLAEELNRGLPPDPSPKIPAFREHDPATGRLTIDGTVSLDVTFPSYFEQLEVIGLYHLLGALAAGMEEDIYRPSYRRKKPEEEAS